MKNNKISDWLLKTPLLFALSIIIGVVVIISLYALLASFITLSNTPLIIGTIIVLLWAIYGMIKRLPHDDMYRDDFIAITNGASILTIIISLLAVLIIGRNPDFFQNKINMIYMLNPILFWALMILAIFVSLYLSGLIVSNTYAKYKRAKEMGIAPWKIILSMPFAFLLMWTPGYLIPDEKHKSNLRIKHNLYAKFNKWVASTKQNTLLTFFIFLLLGNIYTGLATWIWTGILLIIYALWILHYKNNFTKNINKGYALMCVFINLTIIAIMIAGMIFHV